jgi:N-acetylmuramoyl-L-alanine amidase
MCSKESAVKHMTFKGQTKTRRIDKIIIHCSATNATQDFHADDIRKWHKRRGWADIGYHFVIPFDGSIEDGRDPDQDGDIFEEVGAHTYGYN